MKNAKKLLVLILTLCCMMPAIVPAKPAQAIASAVYISPTDIKLSVGSKETIKMYVRNTPCKADKWTSSNKKVATVNKNGVVTAKKAGTATITCKTGFGYDLKSKVTVAGNIELSKYLNKNYNSLSKKVPSAIRSSADADPDGNTNVFVFESTSSLFFRYNDSTKKITAIQNDCMNNLTLYGVSLKTKASKAKAVLKSKKCVYKGKNAVNGKTTVLNYKKGGHDVAITIKNGKVSCLQWTR